MLVLEFDLTGNWIEPNTYIPYECIHGPIGKIQCIAELSNGVKPSIDFLVNRLEVVTLSDGYSDITGTYNGHDKISWFRTGKLIAAWSRRGMQ